jgi:hypothetical protein
MTIQTTLVEGCSASYSFRLAFGIPSAHANKQLVHHCFCRLVQADSFELIARYGLAIGLNFDHLKNAVKKAHLLTSEALGSTSLAANAEHAVLSSVAFRVKRVAFRFEHDPFEMKLARTLAVLREEAEQQVRSLCLCLEATGFL